MVWVVAVLVCLLAGWAGLTVGFALGVDYEKRRDEAPAPWGE